MRTLSLLLLVACAEQVDVSDELAALPAEALAVPTTSLQVAGQLRGGATVTFTATGLPPNDPLILIGGRGQSGPDIGACSPPLGICLDFTAGREGYQFLRYDQASAQGTFQWSTTVPPTVPQGTWNFQVVTSGPTPTESNVVSLTAVGCVEDALAPNQQQGDAAPMTGDLADLAVCGVQGDWLAIDVAAREAIEIVATFSPGDGDLDLELMNAAGVVLDGSYQRVGEEIVTWYNNSNQATTVYLWAYPAVGPDNDGIAYDLTLDRLTPQACRTDAFEPDDDAASATPVAPGTYPGHVACFSDADWFLVDAVAGYRVSVEAAEASGDGTAIVQLYDANLAPVGTPGNPATWDATYTGDVYAEVLLDADDIVGGGAAYTLDVRLTQDHQCTTDGFEPNDTQQSAAAILAGQTYPALEVCSGNDDYYSFYADAGDTIIVDMTFPVADGDIDAALFSPSFQQIARGVAGGDNENFYTTAPTSGTYTLRVYLYGDYGPPIFGGAAYDLMVTVQ